jgi:hypothetical protein
MSSIGSGPMGVTPLASSVAGAAGQQKAADANRVQQDGNVQRFQLDRADQLEKTVGDIGESDGTDERDADGRMPWVVKRQGAGGGQEHESSRRARPADPQEERGGTLDLDA